MLSSWRGRGAGPRSSTEGEAAGGSQGGRGRRLLPDSSPALWGETSPAPAAEREEGGSVGVSQLGHGSGASPWAAQRLCLVSSCCLAAPFPAPRLRRAPGPVPFRAPPPRSAPPEPVALPASELVPRVGRNSQALPPGSGRGALPVAAAQRSPTLGLSRQLLCESAGPGVLRSHQLQPLKGKRISGFRRIIQSREVPA